MENPKTEAAKKVEDVKKVETKKVEDVKKVETKKVEDVKKVETKKVETKQEPEKKEPAKTETKKAEPTKKVEPEKKEPEPAKPKVLDVLKTKQVQELKHKSPLLGCRFDPSGKFVFAGAQDRGIVRWELEGGKATVCTGHESWVRGLAFAGKHNLMFAGDYAGRVIAWPIDAADPKPVKTWDAHDGWVRAVAVSPDGSLLATCGNDRLVRLWSIPELKPVAELAGHGSHVYNVAFAPDGKTLVSADHMGTVKLWEVPSGKPMRDCDAGVLAKFDETFRAVIGGARSLTFSPDGSQVAVAGITEVTNAFAGIGKPAIVLFEVASGKRTQVLKPKAAFQGTAWGVIWHPTGFIAAVGGGSGGSIWFWKSDKPDDYHLVKLANNGRDLDLHPDGFRLAVPHFDGAVRIFQMTA